MEKIIKDYDQTKSGFKVVQEGNIIKSYNKMGKEFHFIDLDYLKDGILLHGWIGFRTSEQLMEVLDGHFLDTFVQNNCKKMIINNTEMTGSFSAVNDWLGQEFMPKMVNSGLTHNAVVLPKNLFAELAVEDWDEKISGFASKNFGSLQDAVTWVKSN
ncbi:MAG: hypothetical protein N4A74_22675 [Carboxylicivirga sp.]|jgi:hypothetical protein|nr:hypothetical protein [Carboxylicivirga sp.]